MSADPPPTRTSTYVTLLTASSMTETTPQPDPHFRSLSSWREAADVAGFVPREPRLAGLTLRSLAVYVLDHRHSEVPPGRRSIEAHYDGFVLSQSCPGADEAARLAVRTRYGRVPETIRIHGREGRSYELGAYVPPNDPDGRSPAVVTWHDGDMHFFLVSDSTSARELIRVAESLYV